MSKYIESTAEGKTWSIDAIKHRGFVTGAAMEGERYNDGGMRGFTCDMFGSRKEYAATTAKRATAKANGEAVRAVVENLRSKGLVPTDAELSD